MSRSSLFNARNHHVNEATANVLFVELLASPLHIVLVVEEHQCKACLLALSHLNDNVIISQIVVGEEVHHILLRCLVGDASQLDATAQVLLVEEVLEVHSLAVELIIHKALELVVGHLVKLDPARSHILALLLVHGIGCLILILKQYGGLTSLSAISQLTYLDRVAHVGIAREKLLNLLNFNAPRQTTYLQRHIICGFDYKNKRLVSTHHLHHLLKSEEQEKQAARPNSSPTPDVKIIDPLP